MGTSYNPPPAATSGPAGGDLTGTYPNPSVAKVEGITITGTPSTGQIIIASSSTAASWQNAPGGVTSVFGRTGVITAANGDYTVGQVTGAAPLASPTFTGTVTVPNGVNPTDAAAFGQITAANAGALALTGGTMSGAVAMGSHKITGLTNGSAASDAAAFGQIPVPANGYGITGNTGATPTPAVTLTTNAGHLATDTALASNTPVDLVDTATLGVGTWEVCFGLVATTADAASGISFQAAVKSGTATLDGQTSAVQGANAAAATFLSCSATMIVTVTVAAVIKMTAVCSGASGATAKASGTINNQVLTNCTGYTAKRLA